MNWKHCADQAITEDMVQTIIRNCLSVNVLIISSNHYKLNESNQRKKALFRLISAKLNF
jgi:hypothetical protein